jgi:hypothetical protein
MKPLLAALALLILGGSVTGLLNTSYPPYVCDLAHQVQTSADLRVRLWGMAQKEIGIQPDFAKLRNSSFIDDFYGGHDFGYSIYVVNDRPIQYTRIWKNGNSGIRASFFVHTRSVHKNNAFCPDGGNKCTPDDFDHLEKDYDTVSKSHEAATNRSMQSFSFIRRPVSHFLSGLKEYYWVRNYRAARPEQKKELVTPADLALFIRSFLDVTNTAPQGVFITPLQGHLNVIPHVYLQSTVFRERYGRHLIGRIESFQEDWQEIQAALGIDVPIKKEYGERESSKDAAQVGASWNTLLTHRPQFLRALCWLLLPDFLCFNYQLPKQCEDTVYHLRYAYLQ